MKIIQIAVDYNGKIIIKDIPIVKETAKQLKVDRNSNTQYREIINKSELGILNESYGKVYIFCEEDNKNKAVTKVQEHYEKYREQIKQKLHNVNNILSKLKNI